MKKELENLDLLRKFGCGSGFGLLLLKARSDKRAVKKLMRSCMESKLGRGLTHTRPSALFDAEFGDA